MSPIFNRTSIVSVSLMANKERAVKFSSGFFLVVTNS